MITQEEKTTAQKLLNNPFEVNQELGIAMLKSTINISKERKFWNELMTSSIQKLRFCLEYELEEEIELIQLTDLSLSKSSKVTIVERFPNLKQLKITNQSYPCFSWVIKWAKLEKLDLLSLSHNRLGALHESMDGLTRLRSLYLSYCRLIKLHSLIANWQNLRVLVLAHNRLRKLPTQLGALKKLEHLNLSNNQLEQLGGELGSLSRLRELHLKGNRLTALPHTIGKLHQLRYLQLAGNKIEKLPNMEVLQDLRVLNVRGNPITQNWRAMKQLREQLPYTLVID